MALQKSIELASGVTANYWKIIGLDFGYGNRGNTEIKVAHIKIAGFVSQETRQEGKISVTSKMIDVSGDDFTNNFTTFTGDARVNAYDYLKSIPDGEFLGSVDV